MTNSFGSIWILCVYFLCTLMSKGDITQQEDAVKCVAVLNPWSKKRNCWIFVWKTFPSEVWNRPWWVLFVESIWRLLVWCILSLCIGCHREARMYVIWYWRKEGMVVLKSSVTVSEHILRDGRRCNFFLLLRFEDKRNSCMYDSCVKMPWWSQIWMLWSAYYIALCIEIVIYH